tara:strand:- start:7072 stop:8616 length:1545 start_codon:yes stop_codon:yes gene_type:complete
MVRKVINFKNLENYLINDPILDWLDLYGNLYSYEKDKIIEDNFILKKSIDFKGNSIKELLTNLNIKFLYSNRKTIIYNNYLNKDFYYNLLIRYFNYETQIDLLLSSKFVKKLYDLDINDKSYCMIKFAYFTGKVKKNNILSNDKRHLLLKYRIFYDYNLVSRYHNISPKIIIVFRNIKLSKENYIIYDINTDFSFLKKNISLAKKWYKFLLLHGSSINLDSKEKKIELYPNMKNLNDNSWRRAKEIIANKYNEITLIWNMSYKDRNFIIEKYNVDSWDKIELDMINKSEKKKKIIYGIININKGTDLTNFDSKNIIKRSEDKEIFVDYELLNNIFTEDINFIEDTFVFMIGALFIDRKNGTLKYKYYLVENISTKFEKKIFNDLVYDIKQFSNNISISVYHWGDIESIIYKNIKKKYNIDYSINFIDLNKIIKNENIFIKSCFNYSLKSVGKALITNNIIKSSWKSNVSDGFEAMIEYYNILKKKDLLNGLCDLVKYNYADVKILQEIKDWIYK